MVHKSIVSVYGIRAGEEQPRRLGRGQLVHERVVTLGPRINEQLSSADPPQIVRVGIAGVVDDAPYVEVIEVLQIGESGESDPGFWAAELRTSAECPTNMEAESETGFPVIPANGVCFVFRFVSWC